MKTAVSTRRASRHNPERTYAGKRLTELFLIIFKVHGLMLSRGNELVRPLKLSGHQWQIMSSVRVTPLTMAQIARRMGLTRQGVRQVVMRLIKDGMVELASNPDHLRSRLVGLTPAGRKLLRLADSRQAHWVNGLASQLDSKALVTAHQTMSELCAVLEWQNKPLRFNGARKTMGDAEGSG
ncbi:MAG: MarR family transcriptional regulator [Candidatus Binataceae bacterium]|nr:MarR family transcriptional regulator [Candidatus Binataceae bacterium]